MTLALTDRRLVVLSVPRLTKTGRGGDVTALFSAVPLAEVDSIKVKRLVLPIGGKLLTVTVRGVPIALQVHSGLYDKQLVADRARQGARPSRSGERPRASPSM
jgi:hypothetical protein